MTMHTQRKTKIGDVTLASPFILGPMAGVTDRPFRRLCKEMGAGLVCMEMVSANAVTHGNQKTLDFVRIDENEHPVSMQLFGPDAAVMASAANALADVPYDILDINMGCPVPKIVKNREGSALMRDIPRAADIVRTLAQSTDRPVTVKMRAGFSADEINAVEMAQAMEAAGAAAIAVHGRTREQLYSGKADWEIIRQVKAAVSVPVIGNGAVRSAADALAMMAETGCDFVMIARASQGNPWIFREANALFATGETIPRPTKEEVKEMMRRHAQMQLEEKGDYIGILEMRKHIAWYTSGFPNAAMLRKEINEVQSFAALEAVIARF